MDRRTTNILIIMASVFFCGLPGLCILLFGFVATLGGIEGMDPGAAPMVGFMILCLGLIGILVPFIVGFVVLRKKPAYKPRHDEPIPPPN